MKSVINKDIQTLFLYKDLKYSTDKRYNIILSPEFYWCRIFDIPVNSKSQIKKILPTLFEDILPHEDFEYHAIKLKENRYICFAYESSKIIEKIKDSGLNPIKLNNIYFAQTELISFCPFKIENLAYIEKEEILIQIPQRFLNDDITDLNLKNINLSNHKIKLNIHQNIISLKNIYIISASFLILALINSFAILSLNNEKDIIDENKSEMINNYGLPKTSIQLNSMIRSLKSTNTKQYELRMLLDKILLIKQNYPNTMVTHIQYNNKMFLEIKNLSFGVLKNTLQDYSIKEVSNKNNTLKVEINI